MGCAVSLEWGQTLLFQKFGADNGHNKSRAICFDHPAFVDDSLVAGRRLSSSAPALFLLPAVGAGVITNAITVLVHVVVAAALPLPGSGQIADPVAIFINKVVTLAAPGDTRPRIYPWASVTDTDTTINRLSPNSKTRGGTYFSGQSF